MQQAMHSSISVGRAKIWALAIFFGASGQSTICSRLMHYFQNFQLHLICVLNRSKMHKCIAVHQIRLFWSRGGLMRGGMHQCASDAKYIQQYIVQVVLGQMGWKGRQTMFYQNMVLILVTKFLSLPLFEARGLEGGAHQRAHQAKTDAKHAQKTLPSGQNNFPALKSGSFSNTSWWHCL